MSPPGPIRNRPETSADGHVDIGAFLKKLPTVSDADFKAWSAGRDLWSESADLNFPSLRFMAASAARPGP
jgi:hypothetical protein